MTDVPRVYISPLGLGSRSFLLNIHPQFKNKWIVGTGKERWEAGFQLFNLEDQLIFLILWKGMRDLNFYSSILQVKSSRLKDITWLLNSTQVRVVWGSVWGCLFQNSVPNNPSVHQLMGEQINKWYNHIVEYYATRNDVLVHAKTWNNLENMLSERIQTEKGTYCMIPFIWNARIANL